MRRLGVSFAITALAIASACTADGETDPDAVDRLVIVDPDGQVVTTAPDGSDPLQLSADGDVAFQPIWSPDSTRVAYASVTGGGVTVADAATAARSHVATGVSPFYLHWSPDGSPRYEMPQAASRWK